MNRLGSRIAFSFALLAAVAVAALAVVSLGRAVETFQPLGFVAAAEGGGWTVLEVGAEATGLRPGDQILLAAGEVPAGTAALGERLRARPETALVVLRGGELAEIAYERPPIDLDWPYLILAAIGVLYLLIGFYTLLRDRRLQGRLFYLWCLASAAVYLLTPSGLADPTGRLLFAVEEVALALVPPLTLHLFLVFPRPLAALRRAAGERDSRGGLAGVRWTPFLYLPAAALLTLQALLVAGAGRSIGVAAASGAVALLDRASLVHLALFAAAALAVLVVRLGRHRDWEEHRQLQWIALGLAVGYLPFLVLYLVPFVLGAGPSEPLTAVAVSALGLVPLTFAWAILRYKLWDIGVVVRDTAATALTVLLAGGTFALAHLVISRGVPEGAELARDLLTFGSGLAIAGLLLPARRRVSAGLERFQYGAGTVARRRALARLGQELLHERDLERLCRDLLTDVREAVDLERVELYLLTGDDRLTPVSAVGSGPVVLDRRELGEEIWRREVEGLTGVALPDGRRGPRQQLFLAGYRYAFPLAVRGVPSGLLVASYKVDELPLSSEDLDLVRQLLDSAALALENARLVEQLQHRLDEVGRLQRFSQGIIESSPAGIAVLDGDGVVRSANAAFAALAGAAGTGALAGRPIAEVLPVVPLPEPDDGLLEVSYCDLGGRERHLQLSTSAFRAPGTLPGTAGEMRVLLAHDVSEQVALAAALREKERLAALGVLAAGVAHEVNTPLTGISSYAQMLLAETPEDDPRHELLEKVERQTFRASRIVNNLLEFARNRDEERRPVDLVPLVRETLDLLDERRAGHRVRLALDLPGEPVVVHGSDGELQQVLTNLVLNALDSMPDGGTLRVELARRGRRAELAVADTGTGIHPARLERIFEPFFSTKQSSGGTGLGLAISHDIVRRHGGDVRVTSEPGEGTRFVVTLPLEEEADDRGAPSAGAVAELRRALPPADRARER